MSDKELKKYLQMYSAQKSLQQEIEPERLEKTIKSCIEIMREQLAQKS